MVAASCLVELRAHSLPPPRARQESGKEAVATAQEHDYPVLHRAVPRREQRKENAMPWTELKTRRWPAFDKDLDGISRETMEDHFKLYEGYAKKANECRKILKEFDYSEIEGNQVYSPLRAVSVDYTFALLVFKNHDLYFGHLGGDGGDPNGRFAEVIEDEYPGGIEMWQQAIRKAASAARGWVMVGYDLNDGSIFNYIMDTQNLWAVYNMVPVLALDVYEHAYARDYG